MILHLYPLWCDHHSKTSNPLSLCKVITILLTTFPGLYIIFLWFIYFITEIYTFYPPLPLSPVFFFFFFFIPICVSGHKHSRCPGCPTSSIFYSPWGNSYHSLCLHLPVPGHENHKTPPVCPLDSQSCFSKISYTLSLFYDCSSHPWLLLRALLPCSHLMGQGHLPLILPSNGPRPGVSVLLAPNTASEPFSLLPC